MAYLAEHAALEIALIDQGIHFIGKFLKYFAVYFQPRLKNTIVSYLYKKLRGGTSGWHTM